VFFDVAGGELELIGEVGEGGASEDAEWDVGWGGR
jgi:hypothetical protein